VLDELGHYCHLNVTEQAAGIILPYVVAAEPGPYLRDVATALLHPGERGVEIPVGRPISGSLRGDLSDGRERCFLIGLGTRLRNSAVLHQGEHSTPDKHVGGLLPADLGVNPVKRGRAEHGPKLSAGKRCLLEPGVHEFDLASACQVLPGQCDQARAGFECGDVQAPGDKAARQLAGPAPDLKHMVTAADLGDLTGSVDEFVGISRTVTVVLSRDLIENLGRGDRSACHVSQP
jgi:hypothetical protein